MRRSLLEFTRHFVHSRGLTYEDLQGWMRMGGVSFARQTEVSPKSTLVPEEYKFEARITAGDLALELLSEVCLLTA
jgi:hypothetical protein